MKRWTNVGLVLLACTVVTAKEYHVSKGGHDTHDGSAAFPFKTISAAAQVAQPGDRIIVYEGVYRERIDPPCGGTSDDKRIVYQAAPGERVAIKGSDPVTGWQPVQNDAWKVRIPNSFFGDFNPYQDLINGDWFNPLGRAHHTGAVYLNGHWLTEAAQLEHVLKPIGQASSLYAPGGGGALLNVAWLQPGKARRVEANSYAAQQGIQKAPCSEGGECIGSMGPAFSRITDNTIHDIHVRRLFTGAEMAGIKFHGAVDTVISRNHIYRTTRGIWLDWMTQGMRVTRNLLHDNGPSEDLFVEVNHGPFLVDNNILLSGNGILVNSQGAAYVHNLIAGRVHVIVGERRLTPHLEAHATDVAGLAPNPSGDERYYDNIFVNSGLAGYDAAKLPVFMDGNLFLNGAKPSKHEANPLVQTKINPELKLEQRSDGWYLQINFNTTWADHKGPLVTTEMLGKAKTTDLPYEAPDGKPYRIDTDYFGNKRDTRNPYPGPFNEPSEGKQLIKVWPRK